MTHRATQRLGVNALFHDCGDLHPGNLDPADEFVPLQFPALRRLRRVWDLCRRRKLDCGLLVVAMFDVAFRKVLQIAGD